MDPISDMLIRIKNASLSGKSSVMAPYSKIKMDIVTLLEREGFVDSVSRKSRKGKKMIDLALLYGSDGSPRIRGVKRISKPSRRIYNKVEDIKKAKRGLEKMVLTTPKGIITDDSAIELGAGGEALFKIW